METEAELEDRRCLDQACVRLTVSGERTQTEVEGVRDVRSPVRPAGGEEERDDSEDQRRAGGEGGLHQGPEEEAQRTPGEYRQAAGDRHPDARRVRDGRVPAGEPEHIMMHRKWSASDSSASAASPERTLTFQSGPQLPDKIWFSACKLQLLTGSSIPPPELA